MKKKQEKPKPIAVLPGQITVYDALCKCRGSISRCPAHHEMVKLLQGGKK